MHERDMQFSATQLRRLNLPLLPDLYEAFWKAENERIATVLAAYKAENFETAQGSSGLLSGEEDRSTMGEEARMSDLNQLGIRSPEPTDTGAKKFDGDKPRYDLLPPFPMLAAAQVFTFGAAKYGDRNWEQGLDYGRLKGALYRHIESWWMGEELDPESGLPHLGHAMCCMMMLTEEHLNPNYSDACDDRPPAPDAN